MFLKKSDPYLLIVGMTGVKRGDRFVQIGCAHGGRLGAIAACVKAGFQRIEFVTQ